MRDTTQTRTMDDYFNSLLLDDLAIVDEGDDLSSAPAPALQPNSKRVPEVAVAPYLEQDPRLVQLSELLAQAEQMQFENDPLAQDATLNEPQQIVAEQVLLPSESEQPAEVLVATVAEPITTVMTESQVEVVQDEAPAPAIWENIETGNEFQALFFDVAGVTFAVPLTELGGIHQIGEVTSLFGQPGWYKGIMTSRDQKMNVVDTAQWVMSDQQLEVEEYNYLIMLGESPWGLACHHLKGTELLHRDQVKWRHQEGKRPWLAGMVKERMCALLHVQELLQLLERGVNIEGG